MRDDEAARLVCRQLPLQRLLALDVEMVCRLVEQVEVRVGQPQHQHAEPRLLPAGELPDRPPLLLDGEAGAGQIECTINGIGERAGNCSLEEIVMALRTRNDFYGCQTGINTQRLVPTSRLVSRVTGLQVQRNKAIVGRNAFAHEAGIHQDGMLKEPSTYEIMRPADVGFAATDLVLGKHSGRAALADRARSLGFHLTGEQLQAVFAQFKELADKKKEIYDSDIAALCEQQIRDMPVRWNFVSYEISTQTGQPPAVRLQLRHGKEDIVVEHSGGDGPIDAVFLAIEKATGIAVTVKDFRVQSVSKGKDAQGESTVELEHQGRTFRGRGVSTDSLEAGARAFLDAVNRIAMMAGLPAAANAENATATI